MLTQHALERYMERSGSKHVHRALGRISSLVAQAVPIDKKRVYARGWIMRVDGGDVVTMYRPTNPRDMAKIFMVMQEKGV